MNTEPLLTSNSSKLKSAILLVRLTINLLTALKTVLTCGSTTQQLFWSSDEEVISCKTKLQFLFWVKLHCKDVVLDQYIDLRAR